MSAVTALSSFAPPPLRDHGWFGWNIARGSAVWSDSVYRLHGYEPGQIVPSSALTFHHKHPEDLYGCVDALHAGMVDDRLVVHEHRLVDRYGQVQPVVMVCRSVSDSQGRMRNLRGFLLPTDVGHELAGGVRVAQAPLARVVMGVFGLSEAAAHALLAARRPMTARRSREQLQSSERYAATGARSELRSTLEDSLFPLDHLTLEPLDLAA